MQDKSSLSVSTFCLFALSVFALLRVDASSPPPPQTLAQRVERSTHVIVGMAKRVKAVEGVRDTEGNITIKDITPQPELLHPSQYAQIEIEVEEILYPRNWESPKTLRYMFGGGHFEMKSIREDVLNRKVIYLMETRPIVPEGEKNIFFPSWGWHLCEALNTRPEIESLLKARMEREEKQKTQQKAEK